VRLDIYTPWLAQRDLAWCSVRLEAIEQHVCRIVGSLRSPLANLGRAGYTYHLLHIQTHPIAPLFVVGNADAAGLASEGQLRFDKERVSSMFRAGMANAI